MREEFAGRNDGIDVPPGLRGCGASENTHPAAEFKADRTADPDGHRDQKSCRIAGDSPDRLWLRCPRSLKKDFTEKNGQRFAHPVFDRRSVLQRTGKHSTSLHEAYRSDGWDWRALRIGVCR